MTDLTSLKSMINNFINEKIEEATLDLHNYITAKTREVAGLTNPVTESIELKEGSQINGKMTKKSSCVVESNWW
jgi:hypothetical protein